MSLFARSFLLSLLAVACTNKDLPDDSAADDSAADDSAAATDADGDGYAEDLDCDDADPAVHPGATELCDDLDNDCDGVVDPDSAGTPWYRDTDGDQFGDPATAYVACEQPPGTVADGSDCDDREPAIHPGAVERCDALDQDEDCDGAADDADDSVDIADFTAWYADTDGDTYGDPAAASWSCDPGPAEVADATDCDDTDAAINPGAQEVCDAADVDEDCDGASDDADDSVDSSGFTAWYADTDGDGYGDAAAQTWSCDATGAEVVDATDCDDGASAIHPGAQEVCDAADVDEDCDGAADDADDSVDSAGFVTGYTDSDSDGYGDPGAQLMACDLPSDAVVDATDCDDNDGAIHPGAQEVCDAFDVDEDCSGAADDADPNVDESSKGDWYSDSDSDGYGDADASSRSCEAPSGSVSDSTDCDDSNASIHPGAQEVCDDLDVDEDCDTLSDDADPSVDSATFSTWYADLDADGYGDVNAANLSCDVGAYEVTDATDCDDADSTAYPGAPELCDLVDHDCDGSLLVPDQLNVPSDYATVQDAIDAAVDGDAVCVQAGTYIETIDFLGKAITVSGVDQDTTILDGNGVGPVVSISSGEGSDSLLTQLTVTGGVSSAGAGVYILNASPVLRYLTVSGNSFSGNAGATGAGVYVSGGDPLIDTVEVRDNSETVTGSTRVKGTGVYLNNSSATLLNLTVAGNLSNSTRTGGTSMMGFGIFVDGNSSDVLADNLIVVDNIAYGYSYGFGPLTVSGGVFTVYNAIVAGNAAIADVGNVSTGVLAYSSGDLYLTNASIVGEEASAPGIVTSAAVLAYISSTVTLDNVSISDVNISSADSVWGELLAYSTSSSITITNSNTYSTSVYTHYYGISDPTGSDGNISADPLFNDITATDAESWDLQLQSSSPLIDAGNPSIFDPDGSVSDIGAYGGEGAADW